ncbi:MAG: hypothetical protein H7Y31_01450 [Chitinophagaceae bacterium]|nr:hypothetical protein [Chitinophagaceae bacterium]
MKQVVLIVTLFAVADLQAQDIYRMPQGANSSISTFENMNGVRGAGGKTNNGAKGNAWEPLNQAG